MPIISFLKDTHLKDLFNIKRLFVYTIIILFILVGHFYFMQMSLETFRYIRHSTMSMMCLLCFFGAFMIVTQKKMVRSDMLFVLLLIFSGSTNLISLIKGFTTGYAGVVEYKFMSEFNNCI